MEALLVAALAGEDAAELELRDVALIDAGLAETYLTALQAGVAREVDADSGHTPATTVAFGDQVRAAIRDIVGGWTHEGARPR